MAIKQQLWTDVEVDILITAYATAHKLNPSKFFTSKDWSDILSKVNYYSIPSFKKDVKQIKNKIDGLIKAHKREQVKQKRSGVPSQWTYFKTMEEIYRKKHENQHLQLASSVCGISAEVDPCSVLDVGKDDGHMDEAKHDERMDEGKHGRQMDEDKHDGRMYEDEHGGRMDEDEHGGRMDEDEHGGRMDEDEHGGRMDEDEHGGRVNEDEHGGRMDEDKHGGRMDEDEHGGRMDEGKPYQKDFGRPSLCKHLTPKCESSQDFSPKSVFSFDQNYGKDVNEEMDSNDLRKGALNSLQHLRSSELIKLSPDSDEFVEVVKKMFTEPTGDIEILRSLFPYW